MKDVLMDWTGPRGGTPTSSLDKSIHWLLAIETKGVLTSLKTAAIDLNSLCQPPPSSFTSFGIWNLSAEKVCISEET